MAKKPELPIPVSPSYGNSLLKPEIESIGRNRIAKLADIDASTVHRNINDGQLTYTTAMKLLDAIREAHEEDGTPVPSIPPPLAPIVSSDHFAWCQLGARLAVYREPFSDALRYALDKLHEAERDALLGDVQSKIKSPK